MCVIRCGGLRAFLERPRAQARAASTFLGTEVQVIHAFLPPGAFRSQP